MPMDGHYSLQRYADPQEHAAGLVNFNQHYVQVDSGYFGGALMQADLGGLRVYRESVDRRIVQHSHLDARCVALGWGLRGGTAAGGPRQVVATASGVLRGGEDWMFQLKPGIELCGITMAADEFDRLAEALGLRGAGTHYAMIRPGPRPLANLQWGLSEVERQAPRMASPEVRASLREHLLEAVFQAYQDGQQQARPDVTHLSHQQIVRCSQALALDRAERPPSVLELCATLRVSRRTLQNSFVNVLGQPPSTYLRCLRLGRVRRLLRTTTSSALSVGDAGARWGFFHLGHFAADYRRLFGELPSQTARAVA